MYGNKVMKITLPQDVDKVLCNLVGLNLGYNELVQLPECLVHLRSLRTLQVFNNFLTTIPAYICEMPSLKVLELSSNPISQPTWECCERGIHAMKRYWHDRAAKETKYMVPANRRRPPRKRFLLFSQQAPPPPTNGDKIISASAEPSTDLSEDIRPEDEALVAVAAARRHRPARPPSHVPRYFPFVHARF